MTLKEFDVSKHQSRFITLVDPTPTTDILQKKSNLEKVGPNMPLNYLSNIIKNAVKLETVGQYEESLSWYDKALKIDPKNIDTIFKKALLLLKTGMYEQALFLFDQIIENDPTFVSALVNRKIVLEKLGKHYGVVPLSDIQLF